MSLEVFIHGPGYGETIILRWKNQKGESEGALVDGYSVASGDVDGDENESHWLADRLHQLGLHHLQFLAVTHPHNDHLCGLSDALRAWGGTIGEAWYWNQLAPKFYIEYFDRLRTRVKNDVHTADWKCEWPGEDVRKLIVLLHDRKIVRGPRPSL